MEAEVVVNLNLAKTLKEITPLSRSWFKLDCESVNFKVLGVLTY